MNNVIKALVASKYPQANTEEILMVINATDNPEVATELICGLYKEPHIKSQAIINNKDCEFIDYDMWKKRVNYSYMKEKTIDFYIPKGMDHSLLTLDTYKQYETEWSRDRVENFSLKTGEIGRFVSNCPLEEWQKYSKNF